MARLGDVCEILDNKRLLHLIVNRDHIRIMVRTAFKTM